MLLFTKDIKNIHKNARVPYFKKKQHNILYPVGLVTAWVSSNNHSSFSPIYNHAGQPVPLA